MMAEWMSGGSPGFGYWPPGSDKSLETLPSLDDPEKEMQMVAEEAIEEIIDAFEDKVDAAVTDLLAELGEGPREREVDGPCQYCCCSCTAACPACTPEPDYPVSYPPITWEWTTAPPATTFCGCSAC
jgi:hypothetical protein